MYCSGWPGLAMWDVVTHIIIIEIKMHSRMVRAVHLLPVLKELPLDPMTRQFAFGHS